MKQTSNSSAGAPPLIRQWTLLRILASRRFGATVQELAVESAVHEKTIRRDLVALANVGFPISETTLECGLKRWRLDAKADGADLTFSFDEALSLYLGRRFLEPLAGTFLWEAAQRAFKKVRACLGATALAYLEKMASNVFVTGLGGGDYAQKAQAVDDLLQAIEERKATHIIYRSQRATEPVTYEIHPYGIVYHRGSLYLVAFSCEHGELRHFKIDRVTEVDISKFPFRMPDDFDLQSHLAKSFGVYHGAGEVTVQVRFTAEVARYVSESKWHASQRLTPESDGSLLAEFRLSSTEEIKRWIMSFGKHAVAIAPEELRAEITEELMACAKAYQSSPQESPPARAKNRSARSTSNRAAREETK